MKKQSIKLLIFLTAAVTGSSATTAYGQEAQAVTRPSATGGPVEARGAFGEAVRAPRVQLRVDRYSAQTNGGLRASVESEASAHVAVLKYMPDGEVRILYPPESDTTGAAAVTVREEISARSFDEAGASGTVIAVASFAPFNTSAFLAYQRQSKNLDAGEKIPSLYDTIEAFTSRALPPGANYSTQYVTFIVGEKKR